MRVTSTIHLSRLGVCGGLILHRVITDFMAQGACPLGTGMGGPGYRYAREFDATLRHDEGGMPGIANAGPGADGSQFSITKTATPWPDAKNSIFGEVIEGMDAVKTLEASGSQTVRPKQDLNIARAMIRWECAARPGFGRCGANPGGGAATRTT